MPRDAKTPSLDAGALLEISVAETWFWDGYYVRRGVNLQRRFGAEALTVTDLDVLGYQFDAALRPHKHIGEVKAGKSASTPRPLDRALWLHGLRHLVLAESAEITTAIRASHAARSAADELGVSIQHLDDLADRRARLFVDDYADLGSQGITMAELQLRVSRQVKQEPRLERAYWFLVSEVWFLDPFDALKRCLGLLRELVRQWPPPGHEESEETVRWLYAEAFSVTTLQLTLVASEAARISDESFSEVARTRMASGDLPYHAMVALAQRVDDYVGRLLAAADVDPALRVEAMGAFAPTPPVYIDALAELVQRLIRAPAALAVLPRQADYLVFEQLVRQRPLRPAALRRLRISPTSERMLRLFVVFLRGHLGIPHEVERVFFSDYLDGGVTPGQLMLPSFDPALPTPTHQSDSP